MSIAEKLTQIAENEQKVYDAGFEAGAAAGGNTEEAYEQGVTDGRAAEQSDFWDAYQKNGTRTEYSYAFANWIGKCFKPKYNISGNLNYAFQDFNKQGGGYFDLGAVIDGTRRKIEFGSQHNYVFKNAYISRLGICDFSQCTSLDYTFYTCSKLVRIERLIMPETDNPTYNMPFLNCHALRDILISGKIKRTLAFAQSPELSLTSLRSIINALEDLTGTSTSYKITLGATNIAKLSADDLASIEAKGWIYG